MSGKIKHSPLGYGKYLGTTLTFFDKIIESKQ